MIKLSDITIDHVQTENKYDFKDNFEDDIFTDIQHTCDYLDPSELNGKLQTRDNSSLSYYSHNIRSLPGHWNDHKELLSTLYEETSFKFTCIALQEIWNIPSGAFPLWSGLSFGLLLHPSEILKCQR